MASPFAWRSGICLLTRRRWIRGVRPLRLPAAALLQTVIDPFLAIGVIWVWHGVTASRPGDQTNDEQRPGHRAQSLSSRQCFDHLFQPCEPVLVVGAHPAIHHLREVPPERA